MKKRSGHEERLSKDETKQFYNKFLKLNFLYNYRTSKRYDLIRDLINNNMNALFNSIPKLAVNQRETFLELFIFDVVNRLENDVWGKELLDICERPEDDISARNPLSAVNKLNVKGYLFPLVNKMFDIPQMITFLLTGELKKLRIRYKKAIEGRKMEFSNEINKRRTFALELLKKVKEIEASTRKQIPRPTQTDCVVLANRKIKSFKEIDLIDEYGKPTDLLISIRNSYKSQKNTL
jgi:hypothetical protein